MTFNRRLFQRCLFGLSLVCLTSVSFAQADRDKNEMSPELVNSEPLSLVMNRPQALLTNQRNKNAMTDYTIDVVCSDDPSSVNWSSIGVSETILSDDGSMQQVQGSTLADSRDFTPSQGGSIGLAGTRSWRYTQK